MSLRLLLQEHHATFASWKPARRKARYAVPLNDTSAHMQLFKQMHLHSALSIVLAYS